MEIEDVTKVQLKLVAARATLGCLPLWRLKKVLAFVDAHIDAPLRLSDLASAAGLSRMHFASRFRAATGLRPHDFVLARRIAFAKERMAAGQGALVHVALDAGFQSQAHFCTVFKRLNGVTPTAWQRQVLASHPPQNTGIYPAGPVHQLALPLAGPTHPMRDVPFIPDARAA